MNKKNETATKDEVITSFPSETLSFSLEMVNKIVKKRGDTNVSFKEVGIILGKSTGALMLPVSSCQQYGLLQNVHGKGYRATELFHAIETPIFETDKNSAILRAIKNAPLYNELIDLFNGKVLPDEKGMENLLTKNYKVKTYILNKVVNVFFKNFREFDLIDVNNRMKFLAAPESQETTKNGQNGESKDMENGKDNPQSHQKPLGEELIPPPPPFNPRMFKQSIDIGEDGTATLEYPRNINENQVEALKIHLEATLKALEARQKVGSKKEES